MTNDLLSGCYNMLRFYNQADIDYPNFYVGNTLQYDFCILYFTW